MTGEDMAKGLDDGTLVLTGDLVTLGGHANAPEVGEMFPYTSSRDGTIGHVVVHVDIRGGGGWTATGNVVRERPPVA